MINIYIPELSNIDIKKITSYLYEKKNKKQLICFDGFYEYINDKLYKFKIKYDETYKNHIEIINNTNIFCSKKKIIKFDTVHMLPYEHDFIDKQINTYKLSEKSKNNFIVELINNKVSDYYFESFEDFDNLSLQEDISSFLFKLN